MAVIEFQICCCGSNFIKIGMIFRWDMAIQRFVIWRPSAMLNFWNLEFMSRDLYRHAILLHCARFRSYNSVHSWDITTSGLEKQTSAVWEFYFRFWFRPYHCIGHKSFCIRLSNFIQIGPHTAKMTSCRFSRWQISAILNFRGPMMGSLKSPCTTSNRSSIETIALNCLVFEKIAF